MVSISYVEVKSRSILLVSGKPPAGCLISSSRFISCQVLQNPKVPRLGDSFLSSSNRTLLIGATSGMLNSRDLKVEGNLDNLSESNPRGAHRTRGYVISAYVEYMLVLEL